MRILMLNYEYPPIGGGAANANYYLLQELSRGHKHSVDLITSSAGRVDETEQLSEDIRVIKLGIGKKDIHFWRMGEILRWAVRAYKAADRLSERNKYDLCHCWFGWPSGVIGYRLRKKMPYLIGLRGSDVPGYNPRLKYLDSFFFGPVSRKVWAGASVVVANSEKLSRLAMRTQDRKIRIIHNGVDTREFRPAIRPARVQAGKRGILRLVCVARLIERKGIGFLIRAVAQLRGVHLKIIGDGDQRKALESLAARTGADVDFLGYVPHDRIIRHYQDSDVFVLPSLNEGMSNTALEAMACGLPVIITDTGGTKELIDGNGVIIRKADVGSMKSAIVKMKARGLREVMGKRSRKIALGMSWKKASDAYLRLYEEMLAAQQI